MLTLPSQPLFYPLTPSLAPSAPTLIAAPTDSHPRGAQSAPCQPLAPVTNSTAPRVQPSRGAGPPWVPCCSPLAGPLHTKPSASTGQGCEALRAKGRGSWRAATAGASRVMGVGRNGGCFCRLNLQCSQGPLSTPWQPVRRCRQWDMPCHGQLKLCQCQLISAQSSQDVAVQKGNRGTEHSHAAGHTAEV